MLKKHHYSSLECPLSPIITKRCNQLTGAQTPDWISTVCLDSTLTASTPSAATQFTVTCCDLCSPLASEVTVAYHRSILIDGHTGESPTRSTQKDCFVITDLWSKVFISLQWKQSHNVSFSEYWSFTDALKILARRKSHTPKYSKTNWCSKTLFRLFESQRTAFSMLSVSLLVWGTLEHGSEMLLLTKSLKKALQNDDVQVWMSSRVLKDLHL